MKDRSTAAPRGSLLLAVAATCLLAGCETVALANSVHRDAVTALYKGEPRADVVKRLGTPTSSKPRANGWTEDRHELRLRNDDSTMLALVDVLALGTLSMAGSLSGRPRDPVFQLDVVYDQGSRVVCARALQSSRQNHLSPHTLDSRVVVGPCPQ